MHSNVQEGEANNNAESNNSANTSAPPCGKMMHHSLYIQTWTCFESITAAAVSYVTLRLYLTACITDIHVSYWPPQGVRSEWKWTNNSQLWILLWPLTNTR